MDSLLTGVVRRTGQRAVIRASARRRALAADDVPGDVLGERLDVQRLLIHHCLDCLLEDLREARHVDALLLVGEVDGALDLGGHHGLAPLVSHANGFLDSGDARAREREPHLRGRGLEIVRHAWDLRHAGYASSAVAADFRSLVSLACHDLRTPLATVQGFAKTMLRMEELDEEKRARYLELIDSASDELVVAARPALACRADRGRALRARCLHEADSLALAPEGATGTGATVNVDPDAVATRPRGRWQRAATRHGGVEVTTSVDGPRISIEPVVAAAAPVVLGEQQKDLGAAVAVLLLGALGADIALEGERLTVTLPV